MNSQRSTSLLRSRLTVGALVLCAGLTLTACDKGDPAADAVDQAQRMLSSMTAGGMSMAPSATMRSKQFESISALVSPHLDAKTPGTARAANLIKAQVLSAKGDVAMETAAAPVAHVGYQLGQVRQLLDNYLAHIARAEADEKYSPADQLKDLDKELMSVSDSIAQAALAKDKLAAQIKEKLAQAEQLTASAKEIRTKAAGVQQQAQGVSAVEGLKLFEEAAKSRRQADQQDVQAASLQAEVAVLQPQSDQLARDVSALTHNRDALNVAKKALGERANLARESATKARADASKVAQEIDAAVQGINQLRSSAEAAKLDDAIKFYREAASGAAKTLTMSSGNESNSVKLTAAGFKQSLGEAQLVKARMLGNLASTLEKLSVAGLPQSSAYKSAAGDAKSAFDTELKAAQDTLTEVVTAYESAKDQGQMSEQYKARLTAAAAALKSIAGGSAPETEAPAPAAASKPAPSKPAAAPATGPELAAANKWIESFQDAYRANNNGAMLALFRLEAKERTFMESMMGMGDAMRKLDGSLKAKLGKSLKDVLADAAGSNPMLAGLGQMSAAMEIEQKMKDRTSADFDVKVNSPTSVTVTPKNQLSEDFDPPRTLKLADGQWLAELSDTERQGMTMMPAGMLKGLSTLFNGLSSDVDAGKITDSSQFLTQFNARMIAMMQGGAGRGGGLDQNK